MRKIVIACPCAEAYLNKTYRQYTNSAYAESIEKAGGILLTVHSRDIADWEQILHRVADGVLLQGGVDIHPESYGAEPDPSFYDEVDYKRDKLEKWLVKRACALKIPILGICRGMQMINVAFGGTLHQDIPRDKLPTHNQNKEARSYLSHGVAINENSLLAKAMETTWTNVNSMHHQAVDSPGANLKIVATSDDIVEGIEAPNERFCLGVQWHPEELLTKPSEALFKAFVSECDTGVTKLLAHA